MLSKPERRKRLLAAAPALEGRTDKERGEVIAFVALQEKFWFMVLECFPESKAESRIKEMADRGFVAMKKEFVRQEETLDKNYFRRPQPKAIGSMKTVPTGFEIFDGITWDFDISNDLKASFESDYMENKELHFFRYLPESYRKFVIEPKTNEERALSGAINLTPVGVMDKKIKDNAHFVIKIDIDEEKVKAYFRPEVIPEEPEPKKEKPNFDILNTPQIKEEKPTLPVIQKFKPLPPTVMERLMRTSRKPIISKNINTLLIFQCQKIQENKPIFIDFVVKLWYTRSTEFSKLKFWVLYIFMFLFLDNRGNVISVFATKK